MILFIGGFIGVVATFSCILGNDPYQEREEYKYWWYRGWSDSNV